MKVKKARMIKCDTHQTTIVKKQHRLMRRQWKPRKPMTTYRAVVTGIIPSSVNGSATYDEVGESQRDYD